MVSFFLVGVFSSIESYLPAAIYPLRAEGRVDARKCMSVHVRKNGPKSFQGGRPEVVKKRPRSLKSLGQIAKGCLAQGSQKTTKKSSHGSPKSSQKGSWRPPRGVQRGSEGTSRRVPPNGRVPGPSKNSHFAILGGSKFDFQIFNTILDPPKGVPKWTKK